jgi:hypothetical protein
MYQKKPQKTAQQQSVANHISNEKSIGKTLADNRESSTIQQKKVDAIQKAPVQKKPNKTGLPDNLKSGLEGLSGHSLDDVKVHYNSSKPAQLNAHAYAQGTNIHVASGQEKHLPHEAWHVIQQKQGRVKPTIKKNGVAINDNKALEKEADVMGAKALQRKIISKETTQLMDPHPKKAYGKGKDRVDPGHGRVKNEDHAKARERLDGQREAKKQRMLEQLEAKRAAEAAAKAAKKNKKKGE